MQLLLGAVAAIAAASPPNILFVLVDDYGWAFADWHRDPGYNETATPFLAGLVKNGIELDRHYSYKVRSGRLLLCRCTST